MIEDHSLTFVEEKLGYVPPGIDLLAFCPNDLQLLSTMTFLRIFSLNIFGDSENSDDFRDAWADPIRAEVLKIFHEEEKEWFISAVGDIPDQLSPTSYKPLDLFFRESILKENNLSYTYVHSKVRTPMEQDIAERMFFQVPSELINEVVNYCWRYSYPGYPIQGFQLNLEGIELLQQWEKEPRSGDLFRQVVEKSTLIFYTWPEENNRFAFVTSHFSKDQFRERLNMDLLSEMAKSIGKKLKNE